MLSIGLASKNLSGLEEFCPVGPGAKRGMEWLCGRRLADKHLQKKLAETRDALEGARLQGKFPFVRRWTLRATEHWLCELDKYCWAATGKGNQPRLRLQHQGESKLGGSGGDSKAHPRETRLPRFAFA